MNPQACNDCRDRTRSAVICNQGRIRRSTARTLLWVAPFWVGAIGVMVGRDTVMAWRGDLFGGGLVATGWVTCLGISLVFIAGLLLAAIASIPSGSCSRLTIWAGLATAFAMGTSVVLMVGVILVEHVRLLSLHRAGSVALPVFEAIESYAAVNGGAPTKLADLVPDFIPSIPGTTLVAAPAFEYHAGSAKNADGWELYVWAGSDRFVWDDSREEGGYR